MYYSASCNLKVERRPKLETVFVLDLPT